MLKIAHRGSTNGKVIDHRGNVNYYKFPENSMLSYVNAITEKFDMIEADVILTKDNQLIMYHDVNIGSTYIKDLTYEEIKKKKSYVPTFKQFCIEILPRIEIILDIKGNNNTALQIIDFFNKNNEIVIDNLYFTSFNRNHLKTLHNYNKMFKIGLNFESVLLKEEKEFLIKLLNISFVSIWWGNLFQEEIDFYKKLNIKIFSWTNNNYITNRLMPKDIDGVITDYYY